jgi:lipopolysaccharide/colanic/teichoic acid biosynthesis glycosyltransferase
MSRMSRQKRFIDLLFAIPGFLILSPFFFLVALAIKLESPGPIFFRQIRVGHQGHYFRLVKFRTMLANAEKMGPQITVGKDSRITGIGKLLRKTKVDELPQLFNVIAGEMSLVGPRPEVPRYVSLYSQKDKRVLELMPGITDPASIKYRQESEILAESSDPERTYIEVIMPEKIEINLAYALEATVFSDFKVVLETLRLLVQGVDVS